MKVHYLEIVASDVDAVCAAYEAAHGIKFGSADPLLGGARTAPLPDGGSIGVSRSVAGYGGPSFDRTGSLTTSKQRWMRHQSRALWLRAPR